MVVPATGQQATKKQLRVVSLLQTPPDQPAQANQPIDPNAPPPAPGVAGLPLNITTPDGLAELPVTNTPNPAFDPFASSVVELSPSQQANLPPVNPGPPVKPPPPQPASLPDVTAQSQSGQKGPSLSDEDFQAWLNGNAILPNVSPDPGANSPLSPPGSPPGPVASSGSRPNLPTLQGEDGSFSNPDNSPNPEPPPKDNFVRIPGETVKRSVAYSYPEAACKDRLEGQAEYRIWVSSQATPVVSDIVSSTNFDILDRAVKVAAQKYKITAADANKLVVLPFDFKYSQKTCETKEKEPSSSDLGPDSPESTPTPTPPTPKATEPKGEKDNPAQTNSPSPPPNPKLPGGPQLEEPVVQPTQSPQPITPQPSPSSNQPQPSPPIVQPPAAPTPTPEPVQPSVPLMAPPSNSESPPSIPPADPGPVEDVQPDRTSPPSTETIPPVSDDSTTETTPPTIDNSETN